MPDDKLTVPEVNLLPSDDFEGKPGGQFLKWALTWGKRIVVTTELVVILAFLSRFWFDTEIANLSEKIDQEKLIVQSASAFEKDFRVLSDRIAKARAIEKQPSPLSVYDQAVKLIPPTVIVTQMSFSDNSISLSANSDEISLGKIVAAFKNSPDFADLIVERVSKTSDVVNVNFSLRATYIAKSP